jgi:hypothetical protein
LFLQFDDGFDFLGRHHFARFSPASSIRSSFVGIVRGIVVIVVIVIKRSRLGLKKVGWGVRLGRRLGMMRNLRRLILWIGETAGGRTQWHRTLVGERRLCGFYSTTSNEKLLLFRFSNVETGSENNINTRNTSIVGSGLVGSILEEVRDGGGHGVALRVHGREDAGLEFLHREGPSGFGGRSSCRFGSWQSLLGHRTAIDPLHKMEM